MSWLLDGAGTAAPQANEAPTRAIGAGTDGEPGKTTAATASVERPPSPVVVPMEPIGRDSVVEVSALTKRYGELVAVDELTFSLAAGTVTGFLGPNGAGKTTTLRLLLGLAEPTRARRSSSAAATASSTTRRAGSAPCSSRATSIPDAPAATTCGRSRWRRRSRRAASRRCWRSSSSRPRPTGG